MGVVSWLYIAGVALVGVPIVLHMIRRTPQGRVPFSTLMFLQPSPPRMTHRSRIEHWLLLLLRALAVTLLALAFARPYWRESEQLSVSKGGRRLAVLIDTSASLRRTGLWQQSHERVARLLKDLDPTDSVAVFTFDTTLKSVLRFDEWDQLTPEARRPLLDERLKQLSPSWNGTDLGHALSDVVATITERGSDMQAKSIELVVVSDFQQGCRLESLQQFQWPEGLVIRPEFLMAKSENNAGLHPAATLSREEVKARIENSLDARSDRFKLTVQSLGSAVTNIPAPQEAIIPPGQSRVLKVGELDASATWRVQLSGDDEDFDNSAWFSKSAPRRVTVAYHGSDAADDPKSLRYFLERAFLPTPEREVDFLAYADNQPILAQDRPVLAFVSSVVDDDATMTALTKQVEDGLRVVVIATDDAVWRQALKLANHDPVDLTEAKLSNYAMLSNVDFKHPLFSEFSDAKLADFTKLPIWKHRLVDRKAFKNARILASFDGDAASPALIEFPRGKGSVILSLFGWHGEDSRFVLWSKFVPMLNHLLTHALGTAPLPRGLNVGDRLPLPNDRGAILVRFPTGQEKYIEPNEPLITTEPGLYVVKFGTTNATPAKADAPSMKAGEPRNQPVEVNASEETQTWAVNLDPLETRTTAIKLEELQASGWPLTAAVKAASEEERRQLHFRELEARQKYWQWLIAAGIVVLMLETWLAGRTAAHLPAN